MRRGFWTAFSIERTCGFDGQRIQPLDPVWEKPRENGTSVYRCETHAPDHAPIDFDAVEKAIALIDARRTGEAPVLAGDSRAPAPTDPTLPTRPTSGRRRSSRPKPYHDVADFPDVAHTRQEER
jgi:hypothetical protein